MKKIFLLAPLLLVINSCGNSSNVRVTLSLDAPYTIVSELKKDYALNSTATIKLEAKEYFALPKKDQIKVEYGSDNFTYNEEKGVLRVTLITNTLIKIDASLSSGESATYDEWDMWCNKHETESDRPFNSITLKWDFKNSEEPLTDTKQILNDQLIAHFFNDNPIVVPELLTDLSGTFTRQSEIEETLSAGRGMLLTQGINFNAPNNRYSIKEDQAIIFTDTLSIIKQIKNVPAVLGAGIAFFNKNTMLEKLVVPLDEFNCLYTSDGPLTGVLEFTYVY